MEKIVEQALLFDFYGELLTEHQKQIFGDVVLNDLSLSEIAENQGISRQGVHDLVKRCNKLLTDYENTLHLVEKFLKTKELVKEINQYAVEILGTKDSTVIGQKIEKIEQISISILEEF